MKQIRHSIFETNSSSMHSIVVLGHNGTYPEDMSDDAFIDFSGKMHLYEDELSFGRFPFEILSTFKRKLSYAIASLCQPWMPDSNANLDKIRDAASKMYTDFKDFEFDTEIIYKFKNSNGDVYAIEKITQEQINKREIIEKCFKEKYQNAADVEIYNNTIVGDIDHNSENLLKDFLTSHNISVEEFLLNSKYLVIIDGDEYCEWDKCKRTGLVDLKNIAEEYY